MQEDEMAQTAKTSHGIANTLDSVSLQSFSERLVQRRSLRRSNWFRSWLTLKTDMVFVAEPLAFQNSSERLMFPKKHLFLNLQCV